MAEPQSFPSPEELEHIRAGALASSGIGLVRYRFDGTLLYADRNWLAIVEITHLYPDPQSVSGKNLTELIMFTEPVMLLRDRLKKENRVNNVEYHFRTLSGKDKWVLHDCYAVFDHQLDEDVVQVMVRDITEKKLAEQERQEQNNLIATLISSSPDPLALKDRHSVYLSANPALCRLLGKTEAEIIGKTDFDFFPVADAAYYREGDREVLASGQTLVRDEQITSADKRRWLQVAKTPLINSAGETTGIVESVRDITERHRMEQELRESRERFRMLSEATFEGVIIHRDGLVLDANQTSATMFGYALADILGNKLETFALTEDQEFIRRQIKSRPEEPIEVTAVRKDGTRFPIRCQARTIRYKGCDARVLVVADVTRQKQADEALRLAKENAEMASRKKGVFLANMSHEIRTPLNAIIGMIELLGHTPLNDEQKRFIEAIQLSGRNLLSVINEILDFSKIESGHIDVETVPFDLAKLVEEVIKASEVCAENKGITLISNTSAIQHSEAIGDPAKIRQVLSNLLHNAIKFTTAGHIEIRIEEAPKRHRSSYRIVVEDTGIGIPKERLSTLFSDFTQADVSTARQYGGTGLGLSICKRLMEALGGTVGVTSEAGQGSTFWIELEMPWSPNSKHAQRAGESTASRRQPDHKMVRVLVADENILNQRIATSMLEQLGCKVEAVSTIQGAIERTMHDRFDLILMDCYLHDFRGSETIHQIRTRHANHAVRIIAISGNSEEDRERCVTFEMDDIIHTPFRFYDLSKALDRWVPKPDFSTLSLFES